MQVTIQHPSHHWSSSLDQSLQIKGAKVDTDREENCLASAGDKMLTSLADTLLAPLQASLIDTNAKWTAAVAKGE